MAVGANKTFYVGRIEAQPMAHIQVSAAPAVNRQESTSRVTTEARVESVAYAHYVRRAEAFRKRPRLPKEDSSYDHLLFR
jgi:hypothetical protein